MISVGVGVLMFVAWEYWGTGLQTAREQRKLAEQFEQTINRDALSRSPEKIAQPPPWFDPEPGDPVFRIRIPAIDLNDGRGFIVVEGVGQEELAKGPGHYPECSDTFARPLCTSFETTWPGQPGRVVVSGHRTTHLAPFRDTDELREGDAIVAETAWGTFVYRVYAQRSVSPSDSSIVVSIHSGRELVLTTCDPPMSAARRLITFARLEIASGRSA